MGHRRAPRRAGARHRAGRADRAAVGHAAGTTVTSVDADLADVYARGKGGLMGVVAHPDFATSRLFTTCQTHAARGRPVDIRLVTWQLSADGRSAARVKDGSATPTPGPAELDGTYGRLRAPR